MIINKTIIQGMRIRTRIKIRSELGINRGMILIIIITQFANYPIILRFLWLWHLHILEVTWFINIFLINLLKNELIIFILIMYLYYNPKVFLIIYCVYKENHCILNFVII